MTGLLKVNRLSVHRNKHVMFDEQLKAGVNIIYGDNGSGKSTITDFLYFALGGDLREWRQEASLANYVLAEITAGDATLTLRREVSDQGSRPMSIYFGTYDRALKSDLRDWETFPYARPRSTGFSFSQVLFNAVGIPEAISDGVSNDASSTFYALGAIRFEYCPSCFSPLYVAASEDGHCHLCGAETARSKDESRALAVRLDLEMQINESLRLLEDRQGELSSLRAELRTANSALSRVTAASQLGRRSAASKFENLLADVGRQIGFLDSEIGQLQHRAKLASEIEELTERKASVTARVSEMKDRISATETSQRRRKATAYTEIAEATRYLLSRDLEEHSDFGDVDAVTFDFSGDWIAVNGDKNRVGSASGMVILKNSFLLSLFRTSLIDGDFNLPRWILMDNIEDKGMVQERSWNFQRLIVEASAVAPVDHQIIFSTSKIAPELADSPLVVGGRKYTKSARTLMIG